MKPGYNTRGKKTSVGYYSSNILSAAIEGRWDTGIHHISFVTVSYRRLTFALRQPVVHGCPLLPATFTYNFLGGERTRSLYLGPNPKASINTRHWVPLFDKIESRSIPITSTSSFKTIL